MNTVKEFLSECRKDKAFKEAVGAIDNNVIVDFTKAYMELVVNRCAEVAECENEGTFGGDGEFMDYYVIDKESILKVKKEL